MRLNENVSVHPMTMTLNNNTKDTNDNTN